MQKKPQTPVVDCGGLGFLLGFLFNEGLSIFLVCCSGMLREFLEGLALLNL